MHGSLREFEVWIEQKAAEDPHFSGTFWFVLSPLSEDRFAASLGQPPVDPQTVPLADFATDVVIKNRRDGMQQTTFWHLPFGSANRLHLLFSLERPSRALRFMYRLLARARGSAHLFPIGHSLVRSCVRLDDRYEFSQTRVLRGVSYPSQPSEGGAEIKLNPGDAGVFFERLDEDRRVLKLARMRARIGEEGSCEFTVSRIGYVSYHKGQFAALLKLILGRLSQEMTASVRPFEEARGRFVALRFPEPVFAERASYAGVFGALSRLPHATLAVLHANPYFHATLTNYEDGGEFDVFVTDLSTVRIQGREGASPASFLRLHNSLAEVFREPTVKIEEAPDFRLKDLLEGRV
jgi:hypothetical protein